jgi:hypothetical protein
MTARVMRLLHFGRSRRTIRREVRAPFPRLTLRRRPAARVTLLARNSSTAVTQRLQLLVAPRFDLRTTHVSVHPAVPAATTIELRVRESLVLREHVENAIERVASLMQRGDATTHSVPAADTPRPDMRPAPPTHVNGPRIPAAPIVLRAPAPAAPEPAPASPTGSSRPVSETTFPQLDAAIVADEVMRTLDRRVAAERERRGRV